MKKERIRRDYDASSRSYENRYAKIQLEKFKIINTLNLNGLVLDHGCGTGLLAKYLKRKLIGCDLSFQMCKLAKHRELVVQADIDYLPFKPLCFDAVLSFTSIQNLPNYERVFKEVHRTLKGVFVFTILKKCFSDKMLKKLASFEIRQKQACGEDIGFILSRRPCS